MNMNTMMGMGNMGNLGNKMMNRFFRKVDGVKWDLLTGRVGVQTSEGIVSLTGEGDDAQIELNILDFGMEVPAFAQSTPLDKVAIGDLIYQNSNVKGWVIEIVANVALEKGAPVSVKRFKIMTPSGTSLPWTPPKVNMLGFDTGVMVLRSLMNMLPGGKTTLDGISGSILPWMAMMGDNADLDSLMPIILFSQVGATGDGSAPMGMGGLSNMMPMMMMMSMMKGKGNSGGGFFGGAR